MKSISDQLAELYAKPQNRADCQICGISVPIPTLSAYGLYDPRHACPSCLMNKPNHLLDLMKDAAKDV